MSPEAERGLFLGGREVEASSGDRFETVNPATGAVLARIQSAGADDVDRAVASARAGQRVWSSTPAVQRGRVLRRAADLLRQRTEALAALEVADTGKPIAEARSVDLPSAADALEHYAGLAASIAGVHIDLTKAFVYTRREPLGVCAGIGAWNYPLQIAAWKSAPALAAGNAMVFKPSELTPLSAIELARIYTEAGLPDGVFNVVHGDRVAVERLIEHPDVKAISFVGSTPVAKAIYESATRLGKRVQALGGAKNHMLVLPDADVAMAADAAVSAGFGSAGERCMAIAVVVAVGAVADPLIDAIRERMARVRVGPGMEDGNEMGPLITREHRDRVASYIGAAVAEGADVVVDGRSDPACDRPGFFLGTSLIDNVKPGMRCYADEIFGPVLGVARVNTYDEALRMINENPYGNGTAIFTRDGGAARQFQFDVDTGMVGINVPIPVPVAYYSFGGWKASLFGDLNMYGPEGVQFYTKAKVVTSRWPDPGTSKVDLGFPQVR